MAKKELKKISVSIEKIAGKIYLIRGHNVMLDRDLAELYGVETKVLKQAVRRNIERFPGDFLFELTDNEFKNWRSQFVTSKSDRMGLRYKPMAFIDHEFKPLNDIPKFKNTMLSDSLKHYSYLNFKTGRKYSLAIDQNDPSSLEVSNENAGQIVEKNDINSLPVYDRIAAGEPLEMNQVLEDTFYFPKKWHRGADHFILKVRGDSMRNAGIEDNDYVVIRSQAVAENLDIAVVAIDNSATLKRFSRMGSNILLLADNPKYDPIMLNEDQVSILGVAVGLVKQIN